MQDNIYIESQIARCFIPHLYLLTLFNILFSKIYNEMLNNSLVAPELGHHGLLAGLMFWIKGRCKRITVWTLWLRCKGLSWNWLGRWGPQGDLCKGSCKSIIMWFIFLIKIQTWKWGQRKRRKQENCCTTWFELYLCHFCLSNLYLGKQSPHPFQNPFPYHLWGYRGDRVKTVKKKRDPKKYTNTEKYLWIIYISKWIFNYNSCFKLFNFNKILSFTDDVILLHFKAINLSIILYTA